MVISQSMKNNIFNYKIKTKTKRKHYKRIILNEICYKKNKNTKKVTIDEIKNKIKDEKKEYKKDYYNESTNELIKYMKKHEKNPNEKQWDKYAIQNGYLSSKTIGYLSGIGFNTLCRNLRKQINKEKHYL